MSTNHFYPFDDTPEEKGKEEQSGNNEFDDNFGLPEVPSAQSFFNEEEEGPAAFEEDDSSTSQDSGFGDSKEDSSYDASADYSSFSGGYSQEDFSAGKEETYGDEDKGTNSRRYLVISFVVAAALLLTGFGVYYFFFRADTEQVAEEVVQQTEMVAEDDQAAEEPVMTEGTEVVEETPSEPQETVAEVQDEVQNEVQDEVQNDAEEAGPVVLDSNSSEGQNRFLEQRTGKYYIVVSSFVDQDLAKDFAAKLNGEGFDTFVMAPYGKKKYYRLGIEQSGSFSEANSKLTSDLKEKLGNDLWVLKY